MKKKKKRDTTEIVILKGYWINDLLDFDDEEYENGEPVALEEAEVTYKLGCFWTAQNFVSLTK